MAAAVAISPASGSITHASTVCHVSCTGVPNNDTTAYDATKYPTEPQIAYYFKFARTGSVSIKSPVFSTNAAQTAEWHGVVLPDAGTWTLTVCATADDSVKATTSVVVS